MANRLKKLAAARYTAGSPYKPAVPAYCRFVPVTTPQYTSPGSTFAPGQTVVDRVPGGFNGIKYTEGTTVFYPPVDGFRQECYPGTPAVDAVAPSLSYLAATGWNAGARSADQLDLDGYFEFQISGGAIGAVVGLSAQDLSLLPNEPTHAVYAHGTVLDILESGTLVYTAPTAHAYANVYRIRRVAGVITYSGPGWTYQSNIPSGGGVFLDAALYATGDFVDNPLRVPTDNTGGAAGSFRALVGAAYEGAYAEAYGTLGALSGIAEVYPISTAAGTLGALTGLGYEGEYATAAGLMPLLSGSANGGYPQLGILFGAGSFAPLAGVATGLTGSVGTIEATLGALAGWASQGPYAEASGSLQPLAGYADAGWPILTERKVDDVLLAYDFFLAEDVASSSTSDGITASDEYEAAIIVEGATYDALVVADSVVATQALEATIAAAVLLGNNLANVIASDDVSGAGRLIGSEQAQYAVNVITGALTNYSGFDFTAFATAGQTLYGAKKDGVYWVRPGDDNGATINAFVDFGESAFGANTSKVVEAVYLGVDTDGELYVRMKSKDSDRLYRAGRRGNMHRAVPAKGVAARLWNVSLEIVDASEFEIDLVEMLVGVSTRRITSR